MKEIKAYKCDFCGKLYKREGNCIRHENVCRKNPDNHFKCFDCKHLELPQDNDYHCMYCKKEKTYMIPISSFKKGYISNVPTRIVTPEECKDYEK